jgi:uncharacterized protein (TIGR03437 family)
VNKEKKMNPHSRSLVTLPAQAWFGFVSLVSTTLLVCLLASATPVKAQQPGWSATGSLGTARHFGHTATLLANGKVLVVGGINVYTPNANPCCGTTGSAELYDSATGLFTANSDGQGVAAALAFRLKADGAQQFEPVARFDSAQNRFVAEPIDLGPETDQVFLALFGTGIKFHSGLSAVSSTIGDTSSEVLFADAVPGFVGLDQVNVRLPRSLAGRGEVDVVLSVDGKAANPVRVTIR